MVFDTIVFIQQVRTPSSEVWIVDTERGGGQIAQIDIHYPAGGVDVTVCLLDPIKSQTDLAALLDRIDDELISSADMERNNLRFRVIQGGVNTAELYQPKRSAGGEKSVNFLGG